MSSEYLEQIKREAEANKARVTQILVEYLRLDKELLSQQFPFAIACTPDAYDRFKQCYPDEVQGRRICGLLGGLKIVKRENLSLPNEFPCPGSFRLFFTEEELAVFDEQDLRARSSL
jgi:hypothetical protein